VSDLRNQYVDNTIEESRVIAALQHLRSLTALECRECQDWLFQTLLPHLHHIAAPLQHLTIQIGWRCGPEPTDAPLDDLLAQQLQRNPALHLDVRFHPNFYVSLDLASLAKQFPERAAIVLEE
jgi:hypothetical protein